jgi:hypothetical protein
MLEPSNRSLYTTALSPPRGYVFDQGLATTFSLDLTTLLAIPLHLLMLSADWTGSGTPEPIALLDGLRRVADRISVYCQTGRIALPTSHHVLYGLLESVVVQVKAPQKNGVFHPKLWALRYVNERDGAVLIRVLVLSRNLTVDDSWDVVLSVEGAPGDAQVTENAPLADLLRALPTSKLALQPVFGTARARAKLLADEISRCRWTLPRGFNTVVFRCLGLSDEEWLPPRSTRLAVITPFCGAQAVSEVVKRTGQAVALVSRPEELAKLPSAALGQFDRVLIMDDAVENEQVAGEGADREGAKGLHAKVYVSQYNWDTTVALGSANMTEAGLFGTNVEVMAELTGKRSAVGGIDDLLAPGGLGGVLVAYQPGESVAPSAEEVAAEQALELARRSLATAKLSLRCEGGAEGWRLVLCSETRPKLAGMETVRAWPVSWDEGSAVDASALLGGQEVVLGECPLASITGFVAFSLTARGFPMQIQFVLNLPVVGVPEGRGAAITRVLIDNEGAFLRYVRLLLAQDPEEGLSAVGAGNAGSTWSAFAPVGLDELSLLEELARSLGRNPARLKEIDRLVQDLMASPDVQHVIPAEFLTLWQAFQPLLEEA